MGNLENAIQQLRAERRESQLQVEKLFDSCSPCLIRLSPAAQSHT
jgi:hypothetical protein